MRSGTINLASGLFLGEKELSRMNSLQRDSQLMLFTKKSSKGLFDLRAEGFEMRVSGNVLTLVGTPSIMGFDNNQNYIAYDEERSVEVNQTGYICIEADSNHREIGTVDISTTGDVVGTGTEFTKILRSSAEGRISHIKVNNAIYNVLTVIDDTHLTVSNPPATAVSQASYSVIGTFSPYVTNNDELYTYNSYKMTFSRTEPDEINTFCIGTVIWLPTGTVVFYWGQKGSSVIDLAAGYSTFDTEISTSEELLALSTFTSAVNVVIKRGYYNLTLRSNLDRINVPTNIKYLYAEPGTTINVSFSDVADYTYSVFYFNGNDCKVENLSLNCSRSSNVASGIRGVKGSVVNCSVNNITRGFVDCDNLENCSVSCSGYTVTTSTSFEDSTNLIGSFVQCTHLYNCKATLRSNVLMGFVNCNELIDCLVEGVYSEGYLNCMDLASCSCTGEPSCCYDNCNRLLSCSVSCTKSSSNLSTSDYLFKFCYNITSPYIVYVDTRTSAISVTGFYSCNNIVNASVDISTAGTSVVTGGKYIVNISHSKFNLTTGEGYIYGLIGENNSYNDLITDCTIVLNNSSSTQRALGITYSKRVRGNKVVASNINYAKGYEYCYPSSVISSQVSSTSVGGFNESNIPGETSTEGSGGDTNPPTKVSTQLINFIPKGTASLSAEPPFVLAPNDTTTVSVDGGTEGSTDIYFNYSIKSVAVQSRTGDEREDEGDYPQSNWEGAMLRTTWTDTKGLMWRTVLFRVEFEAASPITSTLIKFKNEG